MSTLVEIILLIWGVGFFLFSLWLLLITLEHRKQRMEDARIKARIEEARKARIREQNGVMFDSVLRRLDVSA